MQIFVLTQYNSKSLNSYLQQSYDLSSGVPARGEGYVEVVSATAVGVYVWVASVVGEGVLVGAGVGEGVGAGVGGVGVGVLVQVWLFVWL